MAIQASKCERSKVTGDLKISMPKLEAGSVFVAERAREAQRKAAEEAEAAEKALKASKRRQRVVAPPASQPAPPPLSGVNGTFSRPTPTQHAHTTTQAPRTERPPARPPLALARSFLTEAFM